MPLIFLLFIPTGAFAQKTGPPGDQIILSDGKVLQIEVVRTPAERARGLMFRSSLPEDQGMLFIFERSEKHSFWMKNTLISLDIIWMDSQKRIIHIQPQVPPCKQDPCPLYGPPGKSLYVLEVNAGIADRLKLRTGMPLAF